MEEETNRAGLHCNDVRQAEARDGFALPDTVINSKDDYFRVCRIKSLEIFQEICPMIVSSTKDMEKKIGEESLAQEFSALDRINQEKPTADQTSGNDRSSPGVMRGIRVPMDEGLHSIASVAFNRSVEAQETIPNHVPMRGHNDGNTHMSSYEDDDKESDDDNGDSIMDFDSITKAQESRKGQASQTLALADPKSIQPARISKLMELGERSHADMFLQQVLWSVGCRYELKQHQFEGVRRSTGAPPHFPVPQLLNPETLETFPVDLEYKDYNLLPSVWKTVFQNTKPCGRRGILITDLGKVRYVEKFRREPNIRKEPTSR